MVVEEEVVGGMGAQKRRVVGGDTTVRTAQPGTASGSAAALGPSMGDFKAALGNLPTTLGEGEHERPLMEAMALGMRDLSLGLQDVIGVTVESWELARDSPYVEKAMEWKDRYIKDCKASRGRGIDLGHMKNYILLGLFMAHQKEAGSTQEHKDTMEAMIGKKLRNGEGKIDLGNIKNLAPMVSYCQIVRTAKKGFLNITLRGDEGMQVKVIMDQALGRAGKRQWDSPMARPIHKDLKNGLDAARKKGSKV